MGDAARALARLVEDELTRPAPPDARRLAAAISARFREGAVAAVVFYGSCLRRGTSEGVLDFYVLVDAYRDAYGSRLLAAANGLLPPNVFYIECDGPDDTLRAKYAVMTLDDFERAATPESLRTGIWARFCQPALLVETRDAAARERVVRTATGAVTTALATLLPLLPGEAARTRFAPGDFWPLAFRETYGYEMRPESPENAAALYEADRERFDRAARAGLDALAERGALGVTWQDGAAEVALPEPARRAARRRWRRRRPLAKVVYLLQLGKTAFTFGDWLPYALWKLERHTGTHIVPSERQRRHPLIWGWPLLIRALWRREFR